MKVQLKTNKRNHHGGTEDTEEKDLGNLQKKTCHEVSSGNGSLCSPCLRGKSSFYSVRNLLPLRQEHLRVGLAALFIVLLCSCTAIGANPKEVVCRVSNQLAGAKNLGSGTLIDKTADGREGLVLTCAHLFSEGTGEVFVKFADGKLHGAKLVDLDKQADLALLAIANPAGRPAEVILEMRANSRLHACGYGPRGVYRCAVGSQVGQAESSGQMSLLIGDPVRSGDSGGGVFDERGRLVAVIWGEAQGVTYASYGRPLRRFLSRVLGRQSSVVYTCPSGGCPQQPRRPPISGREGSILVDPRWNKLQKQLDELRARKQDRGDYLRRGELPALLPDLGSYARREEVEQLGDESASRHATMLERLQSLSGRSVGKVAGTAAVGLLGLSGPAGWGVIAAASAGGWLIGQRMKRRHQRKSNGAGGRRHQRFRNQGEPRA